MGLLNFLFSNNSVSTAHNDVNPGTGLLMLDETIDVCGNPFGTDLSSTSSFLDDSSSCFTFEDSTFSSFDDD